MEKHSKNLVKPSKSLVKPSKSLVKRSKSLVKRSKNLVNTTFWIWAVGPDVYYLLVPEGSISYQIHRNGKNTLVFIAIPPSRRAGRQLDHQGGPVGSHGLPE